VARGQFFEGGFYKGHMETKMHGKKNPVIGIFLMQRILLVNKDFLKYGRGPRVK